MVGIVVLPEGGSVVLLRRAAPLPRAPHVVRVFRVAVTAAAVALTGGTMAADLLSPPTTSAEATRLDLSQSHHRLFEHNRCSADGFGDDVIPSRAMVRRDSGETVVVSFDEGWTIFTGRAPGQLVATCLGPRRAPADLGPVR